MAEDQPPTPPVVPYLVVADAMAAIAFYQRAFGAEAQFRMPADDGKRLLHASVAINGGIVMLSDDFPEYHGGQPRAPKPGGQTPVTIHLEVGDVDAALARAVVAGALVVMPAADMFWGQRFAKLQDPFGHEWSLGGPPGEN